MSILYQETLQEKDVVIVVTMTWWCWHWISREKTAVDDDDIVVALMHLYTMLCRLCHQLVSLLILLACSKTSDAKQHDCFTNVNTTKLFLCINTHHHGSCFNQSIGCYICIQSLQNYLASILKYYVYFSMCSVFEIRACRRKCQFRL